MITNPVNPARGLFLRTKSLSCCSHFHQVSQHSERTAEGKIMSCWSTGCLCQLNPRYRPYNNWGHGFATVTLHDGEFEVENKRIIDGKVY